MSLLNITHPPDFTSGGEMKADHWNDPLEKVENLFQANVHGENFQARSLRGANFRKRGLTEVFQRKSDEEFWTCWPTRSESRTDVPGGALRFRLRAPASVMVFFSAVVFRHNTPDMSLTLHSVKKADPDYHPATQVANFYGKFTALWEGEDSEPGDEYTQASTIVRVRTSNDRPNTSKGIFLPWTIRPMDGTTGKSLSDVRMFDFAAPSVAASAPGLLQAGWHNIRHTVSLLGGDSDDPALVIGNTELVVVADYGPTNWAGDVVDATDTDTLRGRIE